MSPLTSRHPSHLPSARRRRTTRAALLAGCAVATIGIAPAAQAVAWKSASSPLTAYHDSESSGEKQAQAYGTFYNSGGTHARNSSRQRDSKPGGDSVYVETRFQFYYSWNGQPAAWQNEHNGQTDRTTSGKWVSDYTRTTLMGESDRARGRIHVCEDQNNAPDDCSYWAYATFSY